ncbi:hypothetical protein HJB72_01575 [Rhizobium lentis]|uniref:hypothetical protein n=1 Tax=Rhizobium lentis TaxID=1138194 RepID=UPI001C835766|nr:hypothetical protein [Rhizobium lentis]MBX4996681.1 hypothetical protein [Rhizobium lentis]
MPKPTAETRTARWLRTQAPEPVPRIRGYAVAIDFLDGFAADARLIDHSPVLFPEKALRTEGAKGDRRRFGLVEYAGDDAPPRSGLVRHVGDAFFADPRTAEFVWQAIVEKIENDAASR